MTKLYHTCNQQNVPFKQLNKAVHKVWCEHSEGEVGHAV